MQHYTTTTDARDALINSGVVEMFDGCDLDAVSVWMYRNNATPEEAAEHFNVA